ncbi:MAG: DUF1223 domain-containing protein [Cyclobacteriaceae bacterium]
MHIIIRAASMVVATVGLIALTGIMMKSAIENTASTTFDTSSNGFAVVELFTSQGCSSCPSADRFLSELLQESEAESKELYALSFHVDYWDRLGWKDPYSRKAFTDRQRAYAQALGTSQVYTPQMVINGQEAFVGSQRNQGRSLVKQALQETPIAKIESLSLIVKDSELMIIAQSPIVDNDVMFNIALVERDIDTEVKRGENSGRTLHHDNVVRVFRSIEMTSGGQTETSITVPQNLDRSKAAIIVFIQEKASMKILTAKSAALK